MKDRDTPLPPIKRKRLEDRVNDLETSVGKITGELGRIWDVIGERISEATFSISPTKARGTFKNFSGWMVVIIVALIVGMIITGVSKCHS
jgi:hypothetical protein